MSSAVNTGISFSPYYMVFDAAIAAGATLDELARLDTYPKAFLAKLVAWHQANTLIQAHQNDAANEAMRNKGKR